MKLRNKILAMAVVAVAGVNVYLANDVIARNGEVSLLNLENIAEADECLVETTHYVNGIPVRVVYTLCNASDDDTCDAGGSIGTGGEYVEGSWPWRFEYIYRCTGSKTSWSVPINL